MTERPKTLHQALLGGQARRVAAQLTQTIEALAFLTRRFDRDRQMMTDLSQAPDSAAAVGVLTAFAQRSLSDYMAEAARLSGLIAATAQQINGGVQDEVTALSGGTPRP